MKKYFLIILISFLFVSCYSSERDQSKVWDLDFSDFEKSINERDYLFLEDLDFSRLYNKNRLKEIYKFHRGGAYYFSFIFERLSDLENQLRFLETEILYGYWKKESAIKIYELLSQTEDWSSLSSYLNLYLNKVEDDPDIKNYLIKSLYMEERYKTVISLSDENFSSYCSFASLVHRGDQKWRELLSGFIFNRASSKEINDLRDLLVETNQFYDIDLHERLFILAISSYERGYYREAKSYFEELHIPKEAYESFPSLFYKMRMPLINSDVADLWADTFKEMSRSLNGRSSFASSFVSARIYLSNRNFEMADRMFRQAVMKATSDFEADRARWYLMNLYKNNVYFFAGLVEEFAPLWNDPAYFNDILEDYLALISSKGEWRLFDSVYSSIVSYGNLDIVASYSWVKYLAFQSGLLSEPEPDSLLMNMRESSHMSFYNIMATLLAGDSFFFDSYKKSVFDVSVKDHLISGFIDFNLMDKALFYSKGNEDQLNDQNLRDLSLYASTIGNNLRSIQLISYLSPDSGILYSLDDLKLKYPLKYTELIETYSTENGFSSEILTGVIRTESAFTADIISYAGAVGLSQLMPETAREQARKLDIVDPDLTDPETNIRIGSSYVKWITERPWADNMSQMLIAYNAGGGNLRKWKRLYPNYRDELFVELIPYKETRNYVKKVLTSSIIYGTIYNGDSPEEIVSKIYPDFNSLKSLSNK